MKLAVIAVMTACSTPAPIVTPPSHEAPKLVRRIAAGGYHSCLLDPHGVTCWGKNDHGQIGDGTREEAVHPAGVVGLVEPVAIALGEEHSCALDRAGAVWCWGAHAAGDADTPRPVKVTLGEAAVELAAGSDYSCARLAGGDVACWGHDDAGQLGGAGADHVVPGVHHATALRIGTGHTCVIADARVTCWGAHWLSGFFGDEHKPHPAPTEIAELAGSDEIAVGAEHVCGRKAGAVTCFGSNLDDKLGNPGVECCKRTVAPVAGVTDAVELAAGFRHTCVRHATGAVTCWGGTQSDKDHRPHAIAGLDAIDAIAAGRDHVCALRGAQVLCWGDDSNGQLGRGVAGRLGAQRVAINDAVELAVGYIHTCVRRANRGIACWGVDVDHPRPADVPQLDDASAVTIGIYETCAVTAGGVRCVQRRPYDYPPGAITFPAPITALVHGGAAICGLTAKHEVACVEEISDAHVIPGPLPGRTATALAGLAGIDRVWVGHDHVCAAGREVACADHESELFQRKPGQSPWGTPVVVPLAAADVVSIASGSYFHCALLRSGHVQCWGANGVGQLGNGTREQAKTPVEVTGLADAVELVAGYEHACARRNDGSVWCWGNDAEGQLGDGDRVYAPRDVPARVAGVDGAVQIGAGAHHSCARTAAGVWCWGSNEHGRLGSGIVPRSPAPVAVVGLPR